MEHLSEKDIEEIIFLSQQGTGRVRLICNLYKIDKTTLYKIVQIYKTSSPTIKVGK